MADMATPSAAAMSTMDAEAPTGKGKPQVVKPEKPDEEQYKKDVEKAEKEHAEAKKKLVSPDLNTP